MTENDVRILLRKRMAKCITSSHPHATGLREWCRRNNVVNQHAEAFLSGKRGPGEVILSALGLEYRICRKRA